MSSPSFPCIARRASTNRSAFRKPSSAVLPKATNTAAGPTTVRPYPSRTSRIVTFVFNPHREGPIELHVVNFIVAYERD